MTRAPRATPEPEGGEGWSVSSAAGVGAGRCAAQFHGAQHLVRGTVVHNCPIGTHAQRLNRQLLEVPDGFTVHPKLLKQLERRLDPRPIARPQRDEDEVSAALARLAEDAKTDTNLMHATLAAARAGATTGEWAATHLPKRTRAMAPRNFQPPVESLQNAIAMH